MSSNYKPMANITIESKEKGPTLLEKYGHIAVVTASLNLLFLFLKRQFFFLSTREKEKFGQIVEWAENNWENVENMRDDILDDLDVIAFDYPSSYSAKFFGCFVEASNSGKQYSLSRWYQNKFSVPKEIEEEYTLILGQARINQLLDQLCFRINNAVYRIGRGGNCDYDLTVKSNFEKYLTKANGLLKEFNDQQKKLDRFKETNKGKRFQGKSENSSQSNKPTQSKVRVPKVRVPKVEEQMTEAEPVVREPTPDINLKSLTNNF